MGLRREIGRKETYRGVAPPLSADAVNMHIRPLSHVSRLCREGKYAPRTRTRTRGIHILYITCSFAATSQAIHLDGVKSLEVAVSCVMSLLLTLLED